VGPVRATIGSAPGQGYADERPRWTLGLGGLLACQLPLTVAEWRCFQASEAGRRFTWGRADDPDYGNPLQPVTAISWHAAMAYARWAEGWMADWGTAELAAGWPALRTALPTELQWEAAVRGPWHPGAEPGTGWVGDDPAAFNHANTRWLRPSPVGVFSASATPLGLQDAAGNVWEWCSSRLDQAQRERGWRQADDRERAGQPAEGSADGERALRGGAYLNSAVNCRAAFRNHDHPGYVISVFGVRLVRVWLPHS
jgi:formylglycine-generating enzyme required for sulfatase activity